MKVNGVEKKEKSAVQLTVEFDSQEFEDSLNKAYRKNRNGIMIPGFRKGKAPRKIVEKMYGGDIFYEDALNIICPDAFKKAADEENLEVVGEPRVEDFSVADDKSLTVIFRAAVYPEITLGEYKGLNAVKDFKKATDDDVAKELEDLQKRNARIVSVEREAKEGDTVIVDFKGFVDDVPFEGGEAEKYSLTIGSGSFVPGFEEQLAGTKAGDELDVNIKFPEEYTEELRGKDAVFKVKVHEVKENILPELDDEFAKDVSEFDTLDEYKKSIEEKINKQREDAAIKSFKDELMRQAVENMQAEIPDEMINDQEEKMAQEFYYNISSQGMDPDQYLSMMGMDMQTYRSINRVNAEKRIKTQVLLRAVSEAEDIQVTDEEKEEQYKKLAEGYGMEEEKVRSIVKEEEIIRDIKIDKASEIIFNSGVEKEPESDTVTEETVKNDAGAESEEKPAEEAEKKPKKAPAKKRTAKSDKKEEAPTEE